MVVLGRHRRQKRLSAASRRQREAMEQTVDELRLVGLVQRELQVEHEDTDDGDAAGQAFYMHDARGSLSCKTWGTAVVLSISMHASPITPITPRPFRDSIAL